MCVLPEKTSSCLKGRKKPFIDLEGIDRDRTVMATFLPVPDKGLQKSPFPAPASRSRTGSFDEANIRAINRAIGSGCEELSELGLPE